MVILIQLVFREKPNTLKLSFISVPRGTVHLAPVACLNVIFLCLVGYLHYMK